MSHFTVLVIGKDPEIQLAPFDENIKVPEYHCNQVSEEEILRCVDYYVSEAGFKFVNNFDELYKKHGLDWNGGCWSKHSDGTWHKYSTYNPNSKWDWYSLGGRWSGMIKLKEGASGNYGEAGVFNNEVGIDQALLKDISNINEIKTFAVLKDGKWYERGEVGWFATVFNKKEESDWDSEIETLLKGLPEDTLISIYDCHI
ncbi:hypothetical protein [Sphingobacterium kyonggiense]